MNIPVIIMTATNHLRLRLVDISNIHIRSVDTPAFVEVHNNKSDIVLVFPGDSESSQTIHYDDMTISIGNTSGRIYRISGLTAQLDKQTIDDIMSSIGIGKNVRYIANIKYSLNLINTLYNKI